MMTRMSLILAALGLAACTPTTAADEPAPATPSSESGAMCDANKVQDVLGKPAAEVQADAQARAGARTTRVHKQGDPVTMDLRPDRLNLVTDDAGKVIEVKCG